jgi:uncharacterized protein
MAALTPAILDLISPCALAFLAGLIDSIIGGGGLILLPGMMLARPDWPLATILGTNKFAAVCGTSIATWQYARQVTIPWRTMLPAAIVGFFSAGWGAQLVSNLHSATIKPIVLVLLITVAIYTFRKKDFGNLHAPKLTPPQQITVGLLMGAILGFYDGFFGPGTGSFLIFVMIGIMGFGFLTASASAKVINLATNLSAFLYLALTNHVNYSLAIPMAVFNIAGAVCGTKLAILQGNNFIRKLFLTVVTGLIIKLAYDILATFRLSFHL